MDIGNLIWVFVIFLALQPVIAGSWLPSTRAAKIAAIRTTPAKQPGGLAIAALPGPN